VVKVLKQSLGTVAEDAEYKLLERIDSSRALLSSRWHHCCEHEGTNKSYFDSLQLNLDLLQQIADGKIKKDEVIATLQDVAKDMRIKEDACGRLGWDQLLFVSVVTKKDNAIVDGHEIWYVPKAWAKDPSKWLRFTRLSSPATQSLPPGNYKLRVNKGEEVVVPIGGEPRIEWVIELKAP